MPPGMGSAGLYAIVRHRISGCEHQGNWETGRRLQGADMPDDPVYACLIVDDYPINASYWSRQQQTAFGYRAKDTGPFGYDWPA